MARPLLLLACALVLLSVKCSSARVIEYTFHVEGVALQRLCKKLVVTAVNGSVPGPTIYAREGDTLVVHVLNKSPYNVTIHWHGITQYLSCWADGTEYISQCPIRPKKKYTHKFNITRQEGTFWWHAHSGFQRITVYGAIIIYPRPGRSYPFPKPYEEVPILLGEWYNQNIVELEEQLAVTGFGPNASDAFTINGWPGDFYTCSSQRRRSLQGPTTRQNSILKLPSNITDGERDIFTMKVKSGKTYLLRIINAALNTNQFFKIANHNMTVVAIDGIYTNPYPTDLIVVAPGQTVDVLLTADQPRGQYYMASIVYRTSIFTQENLNPATGILVYDDDISSSVPAVPTLPDIFDTTIAHKFLSSLTGLVTGPFWAPVPREVDEHMFITVGFGLVPCDQNPTTICQGFFGQKIAASLNNVSFLAPTELSLLEAFYNKVDGIYTTDFPDEPPVKFDYVDEAYRFDRIMNTSQSILMWTAKSTKVKQFKYNATVEIVFQAQSLLSPESHPMHIHGHNFYVLGQGFGIYDPSKDAAKLNFVNPQMRHTVVVPIEGWAVIRFRADNPGAWYVHCHNEGHVPIGLAGAFIVENGPTLSTMLPSPPQDLPQC